MTAKTSPACRRIEIVKLGISHVPEGRMIFANLTVLENLQMGAYLQTRQENRPARTGIMFSPCFRD